MRKRDMFSARLCSCEKAKHAVSQTTARDRKRFMENV